LKQKQNEEKLLSNQKQTTVLSNNNFERKNQMKPSKQQTTFEERAKTRIEKIKEDPSILLSEILTMKKRRLLRQTVPFYKVGGVSETERINQMKGDIQVGGVFQQQKATRSYGHTRAWGGFN